MMKNYDESVEINHILHSILHVVQDQVKLMCY